MVIYIYIYTTQEVVRLHMYCMYIVHSWIAVSERGHWYLKKMKKFEEKKEKIPKKCEQSTVGWKTKDILCKTTTHGIYWSKRAKNKALV